MKFKDLKFYELKTEWGSTEKVTPVRCHYTSNGRLAVRLLCEDGEYWSMATVNIDDEVTNENCSYVDTNNNGHAILSFLVDNNLAQPTGLFGFSGFCIYPEYEFNLDLIPELED